MTSSYSEMNSGSQPGQPQGMGAQDGFTLGQQTNLATRFLEPGSTFEEMIINSSFDFADAMDWATIYRKGLKARVPEMVNHAYHAFAASASDGGEAKMFALSTIIGRMGGATAPTKRKGWWSKMRGKTSSDGMPPNQMGME